MDPYVIRLIDAVRLHLEENKDCNVDYLLAAYQDVPEVMRARADGFIAGYHAAQEDAANQRGAKEPR